MDQEKIKEMTLKSLNKLPPEYKFQFSGIQEYNGYFSIDLISLEGLNCQILLKHGFDKLNEIQFMGMIAHELAHYWTGGVKEESKKYMDILKIKEREMDYRRRKQLRKANLEKQKYLSKLKTKEELKNCEEAFEDYIELENRTDNFAINKMGFKEEINEMRKVSEEYLLSAELFKHSN